MHRKKLTVSRRTIRQLTDAQLAKRAGGDGDLFADPDNTIAGQTCYSCDATWCNWRCSQWACYTEDHECYPGRPLVVAGDARVAEIEEREDWAE